MRNNNGAVIRRLSVRSLKNNRMRNFFAISAIILTGMLFTASFSLFNGAIQVSQLSTMREVGTRSHAGLKNVTMEQYEKIASDPMVVQSCYNILIGFAENITKRQAEIRYQPSEEGLRDSFITLTEGHIPVTSDEIIVDTIVMDALGVKHALGEKIPLTFTFLDKTIEQEFTVSGWYEGDFISHASELFISESLWLELKGERTEEDFKEWTTEHGTISGIGLVSGNLTFDNASDIETKVRTVITNAGYIPETELDYGINWAYMQSRMSGVDPFTILILLSAVAVILITGYLIIYNIFQISVMSDIRFYGLLKTIGTTKKQLRRLIFRQAVLLSVIGIPIGLLLGFGIGKLMLPFALSISNYGTLEISLDFDPMIFIFGTVFSAATVYLSCKKPGKIAGNVSPIEAVKYTEVSNNTIQHNKKKHSRNYNPLSMAIANLNRNKKKTSVVIAAISLSMILLTLIVTAVESFQIDEFLEQRITGDIMISDVNLLGSGHGLIEGPDADFLSFADKQDGILEKNELFLNDHKAAVKLDEKGLSRFRNLEKEDKLDMDDSFSYSVKRILSGEDNLVYSTVYGYTSPLLNNIKVLEGTFDIEKFQSGNYILLCPFYGKDTLDAKDSLYHPGDTITISSITKDSIPHEITDENGELIDIEYENRQEKQYEVMAIVSIPNGMKINRYTPNSMDMVFPVQKLQEDLLQNNLCAVSYRVEENALPAFEAALKDYTNNINPLMAYTSKSVLKEEFNGMIRVVSIIGIALAAVIAFIGILNFINSVLTGIIARRREFAMLQSIGMTNGQLKQMLICEGIAYILISTVISFIFGSLLTWQVLRAANNILLCFEYRFRILPFFLMLPVLLLVAVIGPLAAYCQLKKKSIVERLREAE